MTMRYDRVPIKATRNDAGYIVDTPVLTRTGVFVYRDPQGQERREYRPPEVVFAADSLNAYKGIPITDGHPGKVTSKNVKQHIVGTVMSEGRQDGDDLAADIVIHDPSPVEAGKKELSCGYEVTFDETPGVSPQGERYDAIQTSIKPNHLALVLRGRAGNARLNLDAADEAANHQEEPSAMDKIRLDSGLSYEAAPEVIQEVNRLRQDLTAANADKDKAEARADTAEAKVTELEGQIEQVRQDAHDGAVARLKLEAQAKELGVEFKADAKDREIQEAIIKKVRGDSFKMDGKSDDYVAAAFDLAIAEKQVRQDTVAATRQAMNQDGGNQTDQPMSASSARAKYVAGIRK
ncbi:DUF2213 domain-containing protein [Pusillimonas caeni]|uniref:DUF2213 domain-containing protein n=1 Tax=Pusillimonas caeni TaxID=1348472 RepID=UPI000E5A0212|nr:DUF2213 domain-containing protein [Pusillimonas caeni]TFL14210.1 DUF2213 domain-containing protein [Pusillimonas caeni]